VCLNLLSCHHASPQSIQNHRLTSTYPYLQTDLRRITLRKFYLTPRYGRRLHRRTGCLGVLLHSRSHLSIRIFLCPLSYLKQRYPRILHCLPPKPLSQSHAACRRPKNLHRIHLAFRISPPRWLCCFSILPSTRLHLTKSSCLYRTFCRSRTCPHTCFPQARSTLPVRP